MTLDEIEEIEAALMQGQSSVTRTAPQVGLGILDQITRTDPAVDPSGIPLGGFRADLSRMDTKEETERMLTSKVGPGGWTTDAYGRYALTPEGKTTLGLQAGDKPTVIDEPGLTRYDIADLRGNAPAIGGAVAAGMLSGGLGFIPGLALAGLGAAGAQGYDEAADALRGQNLQSAPEVGKRLGGEAVMAGVGEGVYRGLLAPAGRYSVAPQQGRMTPQRADMMQQAKDIGAMPSPGQVTGAPLLNRFESIANTIFGGSPVKARNAAVLNKEMNRLKGLAGPPVKGVDPGVALTEDILNARRALSDWSKGATQTIDELAGGKPVVSTEPLKQAAQDISEKFPRTVEKTNRYPEGEPVFTSGDTMDFVEKAMKLPDRITVEQARAIRQRLWASKSDDTLTPGVSSHDASELHKAMQRAFKQAGDDPATAPQLRDALKAFDSEYSKRIDEFDNNMIQRIARQPGKFGAIDPELVVGTIFKKGRHTTLGKVMKMAEPSTRESIRRTAMEDILRNATARTDDVFEEVFSGRKLLTALDEYGRETLNTMFGKKITDDLYRFGRVAQFVAPQKVGPGGLVAAGIATKPIQNLGRMAQLRILSKYFSTETGLKHFTEGLSIPKTRNSMAMAMRVATQLQTLRDEEKAEED